MSKGEQSAGTNTVRTNSTTGPPQWAQSAAQDLFKNSTAVADQLKPTSIARPADLTPGQQSLFAQLMGNVGASNPAFQTSQGALSTLQGFSAPWLKPETLAGTDLQPYMNPYTKFVKDSALALGDQTRKQALNSTSDAAAGAGAFGGSRQGIQEGVTNSQYALGAANLGANLDAQNFQQAQVAAGTDIANDLNAQAQNAGNAISGAGVRLNAANSGASVAGQQQQTYLQSLFAALTGQNQVQGQNQAMSQFNSDVANANNMLPYQRLQIQQGTLSGVPLAQTTNSTQTGQATQPGSAGMQTAGGIMGMAGSAASIAAMFM